jgi:hypothetical protein
MTMSAELDNSNSEQPCSNLSVAAPVVARLNLNGLMSLLTRTERSVSFRISFPPLNSLQNYLGHSINAPTGRWQKNKDVHWYNRDEKLSQEERAEEIRKVKEAEAEALSIALYASLVIHFAFPGYSFTHTVVLGHQRKNHRRAHKARAQMRYPSLPQQRRVGT